MAAKYRGLSEGVRVAGGDLCRLQLAKAPTEPTGETGLPL